MKAYIKKIFIKNIKVIDLWGSRYQTSVGKWFSKLFKIKPLSIVNTIFKQKQEVSYTHHHTRIKLQKNFGGKSLNDFLKFKNKSRNIKFELELQNPWPGCMKDCINGLNTWKNIGIK